MASRIQPHILLHQSCKDDAAQQSEQQQGRELLMICDTHFTPQPIQPLPKHGVLPLLFPKRKHVRIVLHGEVVAELVVNDGPQKGYALNPA